MHYLAIVTYHPKPGREKEFLKLWEEGPRNISLKKGAHRVNLGFQKENHSYVSTAIWSNAQMMEECQNDATLHKWMNTINQLSRTPVQRKFFEIIKEEAA